MDKINYLIVSDSMVETSKQYLPDCLKDKENIDILLTLLLEAEQDNYNQYVKFSENLLIEAARGWWLDQIGKENGVERNGVEDIAYRGIIQAIAGLPYYTGTTQSTWERLSILFGTTDIMLYTLGTTITVVVSSSVAMKMGDKEILRKFFPAGADLRIIIFDSTLSSFRFGSNSLVASNGNPTTSLMGNRLSSVFFRSNF